jgi:hypothetical protein
MRLHELTDAGLQILELLETGNADYSKALSDINTEFNEKVLDCGMVYRNIQVEAEVYKTESKRLADKANSLEKRAEGLRVYVEQQMEQLGIDSIKGATFTVKFRKLPPTVIIEDLDLIPASYKRIVPQAVEADKRKLLEDLTSGIPISGASLKTDRRKLEIK